MSYMKNTTVNNSNNMNLFNKFLDTINFIINLTILFLSVTKLIRVLLLSFISSVMLQVICKFNLTEMCSHLYLLTYKYEYIDISFTIALTISFTIIVIFNMISEKIDARFEELLDIINEKDKIIESLNKKVLSKVE
jgi:hypothetical protein